MSRWPARNNNGSKRRPVQFENGLGDGSPAPGRSKTIYPVMASLAPPCSACKPFAIAYTFGIGCGSYSISSWTERGLVCTISIRTATGILFPRINWVCGRSGNVDSYKAFVRPIRIWEEDEDIHKRPASARGLKGTVDG